VFLVTRDGDGLSIGGNHMLHILRRNVNVTVLLFTTARLRPHEGAIFPHERVGQGHQVRSGPGPPIAVNPLAFALGCGATFVARTNRRATWKHMEEMLSGQPSTRHGVPRDPAELQCVQRPRVERDVREGLRKIASTSCGSSTASRSSSDRPTPRKALVMEGDHARVVPADSVAGRTHLGSMTSAASKRRPIIADFWLPDFPRCPHRRAHLE